MILRADQYSCISEVSEIRAKLGWQFIIHSDKWKLSLTETRKRKLLLRFHFELSDFSFDLTLASDLMDDFTFEPVDFNLEELEKEIESLETPFHRIYHSLIRIVSRTNR